ncbi:MAG: hypothetical protein MJZ19_06755 [Paludibacteraceae bacterium]|nr:hypothetical protein [Paludibacteraceae bacterium]
MAVNFDEFGYPIEDKWYDNFVLGAVLGTVIPVAVLLGLIFKETPESQQLDLGQMLGYAWEMTKSKGFSHYFVSALLPNMFLFMFFYTKDLWKSCRGFVVCTLLFFALYAYRAFV